MEAGRRHCLLLAPATWVPEMSQAVEAYRHITVTPEFKEAERLYAKARHDEAQALFNAERNRTIEIAKNLIKLNLPIEQVASATGLTLAEIKSIQNAG